MTRNLCCFVSKRISSFISATGKPLQIPTYWRWSELGASWKMTLWSFSGWIKLSVSNTILKIIPENLNILPRTQTPSSSCLWLHKEQERLKIKNLQGKSSACLFSWVFQHLAKCWCCNVWLQNVAHSCSLTHVTTIMQNSLIIDAHNLIAGQL